MKKYILCIFISIFMVIFILNIIVDKNEKTVYLDNKTIVYIGNIPREVEEKCEKWIAKSDEYLPSKLAEEYKEKFYILDTKHFNEEHGKTKSTVNASAFLGIDESGNPIGIYINADVILKQDNGILVTICHEFGHYFDIIMDNPSHSDEWAKITEDESQKQIRQNQYYTDPVEFFAQTFAWYCQPKGTFGASNKNECPQAWNYIDLIIKEYEQKSN